MRHGPQAETQKPKDFKNAIKNLFMALKPYYKPIIITII